MAKAYQSFQAHASHPELEGDPLEGTLVFTSRGVTFRGGETLIEIPTNHLVADFDDAEEGSIILRNSAQPDWTIITSDQDVLDFRSIPQIAALAEHVESRLTHRELSRRGKIVLIFFVSVAAACWLGMLGLGAMIRAIVNRLPPETEQKVGKGLLEELKAELEFLEDTNEVALLAASAEPLLAALPKAQDWQFYVVEEDSPNAFAIPGGHIMVTTGLLELADRPEQVLGVIAHELAHVTEKHAFRQQIASAGPWLVFQVFLRGRGGALTLITGGSALLVHQSFSQEYEKEADDVGWKYLVRAKIDPRGMTEMFQKLKAADKLPRILPKAFESHPDLDKRIARLEAKWKRLPLKSGFLQLTNNLDPNP